MDAEQALVAVQTTDVAPNAGAENPMTRAQEKAEIMSQLLAPQPSPANPATETSLEIQAEAGTHAADDLDTVAPQEKEVKNFRGRWNHLDERERRVVKLVTKRGLSLTEAYHAVYGCKPDGNPPDEAQGLAITQTAETAIAGKPENSQLATGEQHGSVATEGESTAGASGISAQWNAIASRDNIAFPDAIQPGTELHEACVEEYQYLQAAGSPLVNDPQCAQKIVNRMVRLLGSKAGQGASSAQQANAGAQLQPPPVVAKRSVRPVPAGGNPVEAPVQTLERKVANARTTGEMLALMREFGTPIEALMRR